MLGHDGVEFAVELTSYCGFVGPPSIPSCDGLRWAQLGVQLQTCCERKLRPVDVNMSAFRTLHIYVAHSFK